MFVDLFLEDMFYLRVLFICTGQFLLHIDVTGQNMDEEYLKIKFVMT